jgi:hypothetical protein
MKFKTTSTPGNAPSDGKLFTDRERRKLLFMVLLFAAVTGSMIWGFVTSGGKAPEADARRRRDSAPQSEIATPTFRRDELAARVKDGTREERADIDARARARRRTALHVGPLRSDEGRRALGAARRRPRGKPR